MNASVQLLVAGVFSVVVSIFIGEARNFNFAKVQPGAWLALLYLVTAGSLITYLCYLWLLKVRHPAQVSTYVYANPVVAVLLGALFAGERITVIQIISLTIITTGVLLVNSSNFKKSRKPQLSTS